MTSAYVVLVKLPARRRAECHNSPDHTFKVVEQSIASAVGHIPAENWSGGSQAQVKLRAQGMGLLFPTSRKAF